MHTQPQARRTKRNLAIFVTLMVTIGWLAAGLEALMDDPSAEGMGMGIWIISPLVVSILLRIFAGDGWRDLGIRPQLRANARWYGASALIYVVGTALVLGIGIVIGATDFIGAGVGGFVGVFVAALISLFFKNIFEEFGWRGYLAPKVYTLGWNTFAAHGFVGLVWAAWHVPYYLVLLDTADFESYTSQSMITFVPMVFLGLIAASIAYGEIRLLTGSVWSAVLMHAVGNAFTTALIQEDYIKMTDDLEFLVTPGPEGVLSIVFITLVGIQLYRLRQKQTTVG
jgi:membrane protease YdiL (CAAX protease family)